MALPKTHILRHYISVIFKCRKIIPIFSTSYILLISWIKKYDFHEIFIKNPPKCRFEFFPKSHEISGVPKSLEILLLPIIPQILGRSLLRSKLLNLNAIELF